MDELKGLGPWVPGPGKHKPGSLQALRVADRGLQDGQVGAQQEMRLGLIPSGKEAADEGTEVEPLEHAGVRKAIGGDGGRACAGEGVMVS